MDAAAPSERAARTGPALGGRRALLAVAARPGLWFDALLAVARLARRGWWKRRPPLPVPDPAYLQWRATTAYGSETSPSDAQRADDLISYLMFCKEIRHQRRH